MLQLFWAHGCALQKLMNQLWAVFWQRGASVSPRNLVLAEGCTTAPPGKYNRSLCTAELHYMLNYMYFDQQLFTAPTHLFSLLIIWCSDDLSWKYFVQLDFIKVTKEPRESLWSAKIETELDNNWGTWLTMGLFRMQPGRKQLTTGGQSDACSFCHALYNYQLAK